MGCVAWSLLHYTSVCLFVLVPSRVCIIASKAELCFVMNIQIKNQHQVFFTKFTKAQVLRLVNCCIQPVYRKAVYIFSKDSFVYCTSIHKARAKPLASALL